MKRFKKILKWLGIIVLILGGIVLALYFIYLRPFMQKMKVTREVPYDKELTIVLGGGGNSGILCSDSLVMVIDTKMDEAAEKLYIQAKELAGGKPVIVVNTHYHPDHTKGNSFYKGETIIAGGDYTPEFWKKEAGEETLPTQWVKYQLDIPMGSDTATIFNFGKNAHTASDVFVYLHKRKMLFGGDVILNKQAPALLDNADPNGYLEAFETVKKRFDIQKIVPGHGDIGGPELIDTFRQYFVDMKAAAADDSKKNEMIEKYSDWSQIPVFMSPGATISFIKKKGEQK